MNKLKINLVGFLKLDQMAECLIQYHFGHS